MQEVQQFADKVAQTCASQVESAWIGTSQRGSVIRPESLQQIKKPAGETQAGFF